MAFDVYSSEVSSVPNSIVRRDANGNIYANNINAGGAILVLDDTTLSTTATASATVKSFRYYNDGNISNIQVFVSAWNASSGATTTIGVNVDNLTPSSTTTTSTTEQFFTLTLTPPSTKGVHTLNVTLATSNASYSAYTKFLQVEVS